MKKLLFLLVYVVVFFGCSSDGQVSEGDLFKDTYCKHIFYTDTVSSESPAIKGKIKPDPLREVGEEKIPEWGK